MNDLDRIREQINRAIPTSPHHELLDVINSIANILDASESDPTDDFDSWEDMIENQHMIPEGDAR